MKSKQGQSTTVRREPQAVDTIELAMCMIVEAPRALGRLLMTKNCASRDSKRVARQIRRIVLGGK